MLGIGMCVKTKGSDSFVLLLIAASKRKEYQPYGSVLGVWQG